MPSNGKFWDKGPMVVTGCTKVSPGCDRCWSEKAHVMRSANTAVQHIYSPESITDGRFNGKVQFNLDALKKAVKGKPCVIAVWNDLYHPSIEFPQILEAFKVMLNHPDHTFLIVTKRAYRAVQWSEFLERIGTPGHVIPSHIWHIATMENQEQADKRMPHLLRIPGKRGIIIEPMLGPVDLDNVWVGENPKSLWNVLSNNNDDIHQVMLGPENGRGKRPMEESWAESVREQCEAAGVPFFRKDTGQGELVWRIND